MMISVWMWDSSGSVRKEVPEDITGSKVLSAHLGTQVFPRIKVRSRERNRPAMTLADYVLGTFYKGGQSKRCRKAIPEAMQAAAEDPCGGEMESRP